MKNYKPKPVTPFDTPSAPATQRNLPKKKPKRKANPPRRKHGRHSSGGTVESYKDQVQRKYRGGSIKRFGNAGTIQPTVITTEQRTDSDFQQGPSPLGPITPTDTSSKRSKRRVKRQATGTGRRGGKSGNRNRRKAAPRGAKKMEGIQSARIPRTKIG